MLFFCLSALIDNTLALQRLCNETSAYHLQSRRFWKKKSWLAVGTFALLASAKTGFAEQNNESINQRLRYGSGNPLAGKQKSADERCQECHGENGKGRVADNVVYPLIGGQRKIYLRGQLNNWKLGERKNSPGDVMRKVANVLKWLILRCSILIEVHIVI